MHWANKFLPPAAQSANAFAETHRLRGDCRDTVASLHREHSCSWHAHGSTNVSDHNFGEIAEVTPEFLNARRVQAGYQAPSYGNNPFSSNSDDCALCRLLIGMGPHPSDHRPSKAGMRVQTKTSVHLTQKGMRPRRRLPNRSLDLSKNRRMSTYRPHS